MEEKELNKKSVEEIIGILRKGGTLKKENYLVFDTGYIIKVSWGNDYIAGTINEGGVWLTRVGSEDEGLINYLDVQKIVYHTYPGEEVKL